MAIDPDNKSADTTITDHVRTKKRTKDSADGAIYDHYGYKKVWKQTPTNNTLNSIHELVRDTWGGELPTLLDATAGGGSIPFESVRYEFPTIANELNPVASVILKAVLDHPRVNGDLSKEIQSWGEKINDRARDELCDYFPSEPGKRPLEYLWANTIACPDCELNIPLSPNWWLNKESGSKGVAARPLIDDTNDKIKFDVVTLPEDIAKEEYNPTEGTVSYGKATCPRCNVVIEGEEIENQAQEMGLGRQLYAVHIEDMRKGDRVFRAPKEEDHSAFQKAKQKVNQDPELSTFLNIKIPEGKETQRTHRHGITEWRDMFSARQLLVHYTYLQKYNEVKQEIRKEYPEEQANVILTYLAIASDKALDYNCRLSVWDNTVPKLAHLFSRHDFAFAWSFAESNLTAEGLGYDWVLENSLKAYSEFRDLAGKSEAPVQVHQGDAANLPIESGSIQAIVLDPPYYDNVMYAELSDFFYVWLKKYLGDVYPEFFTTELTEKQSEAVANPAKFEDVAGERSKNDLANEDYESKMTGMFDELHRVLDDDGIFTLMFTHKKTEAWDTLTKSLIEAGFAVTSTHPVSTESPLSLHQAGKNSAESTILLSSEKRERDNDYSLWSDIKKETRNVARAKAKELDEQGIDFAKVDMVLASFGPTLRVFTERYPVVDDEGNEIRPQRALDEARSAVSDYLIEEYLNDGVKQVDSKTEWYILSWLMFEAQRFPYDEARRLAIGVGENLESLKKDNRMWRKKSGDVLLRPHEDRVQSISKNREDRSGRKPVDPEALTFTTALDKVHAAIHIQDVKGSTTVWNWMDDRNCGSDPQFKATLEALLRILPHDYDDWELVRDLAVGETGELLDLDMDSEIFQDQSEEEEQKTLTDGFN
jgi:adenine-specific DNA methylase